MTVPRHCPTESMIPSKAKAGAEFLDGCRRKCGEAKIFEELLYCYSTFANRGERNVIE